MRKNLTIFEKGAILVLVPLLFQFAFGAFLWWQKRAEVDAGDRHNQTKNLIVQMQYILRLLIDSETGERGYALTGDPAFAEPSQAARQELPLALSRLQTLVKDHPTQAAKAQAIQDDAEKLLDLHMKNHRLVEAGQREEVVAWIKSSVGREAMDSIRNEVYAFRDEQERLDAERFVERDELNRRFTRVFSGTMAAALLIALILAVAFSQGIGRRLAVLKENTQRLTEGKELAAPISGGDEIAQLDGAFRDMAKTLERQQQSLEAEQRFRTLATHAPVGIFQCDRDGKAIYFNQHCERILGMTAEQAAQNAWVDILHPEDRDRVVREWSDAVKAGKDFHCECRYQAFPGKISWVVTVATALRNSAGEIIGFIGTLTEITKRKRAEEQFRVVVESTPNGMVMIDQSGLITLVNAQMEQLFGYARSELLGQPIEMLIPKNVRERHRQDRLAFQLNPQTRSMGTGRDLYGARKDGTEVPVEIGLTPITTEDGCFVLAAVVDVTERKRAEDRLQQQLARLHLLNQITQAIGERQDLQSIYRVVLALLEENLPIDFNAICLVDHATNSLLVSAVGPKSRLLNEKLGLIEQAVFPTVPNGLGACVGGATVYEPDLTQVDSPMPRKLAQAGLRSLAAVPLALEEKTFGVLLIARRALNGYSSTDCEFLKQLSSHVVLAAQHAELYQDLKNAYDDLQQSQKGMLQQERLRALGQMASGIAHDINNAISPIAIYAESLLESDSGLTDKARDYLTIIAQAIDDVAHTVSRMRDFYRQQEKQIPMELVQITPLVQQVLDLTRAKWRDQAQEHGVTIDVHFDLAQDLPAVMGVESEIRDALTNLVFNAVDAMPQGGTLTIRTRLGIRHQDEEPLKVDSPTHVILEVSDTGIGMDEDTQLRCLEPFFTTKGERGTGLGLAMVFGTMQRHSGDIEIHSVVGKGTTFRLLFLMPHGVIHDRTPVETPPTKIAPLRVLVVDDDAVIRKSLQDTLQENGHHVAVADGGQAGIDEFTAARQRGQPFEVVITDLGMPHIDGRAVAQAVKAQSEATPVILLTGWGRRMKTEGDIPPNVDRLLAKPPKMKDLREALAAVAKTTENSP